MSPEALVRSALLELVGKQASGPHCAIAEFWVPKTHERADVAIVARSLDGFEIKTEHDTLRRLPRQVAAYSRIFDRCTAVVAGKHLDRTVELVPGWWGITTVHVKGGVSFQGVRKAKINRVIDAEVLVRLLWKDEVAAALRALGHEPAQGAARPTLWRELQRRANGERLREIVRKALLTRDPGKARIPTRRFTSSSQGLATG